MARLCNQAIFLELSKQPGCTNRPVFLSKLVLFLAVGICVFCVQKAEAQELMRDSLAGADVAEARINSLEEQNYNIKLGPVRLQLTATAGFEYIDNISYSDVDRESDEVVRVGVDIHSQVPLTKLNVLKFDLGIAFERYINHPDATNGDIVISPGSELAVDIFVADIFRINIHDRFDLRQDPVDQPSLSNVTNFARFTNTAGVTVVADLNALVLTAGYDHFNYASLGGDFTYLDRSAELFLASAIYQLAPRTFLGVEGTASLTNYNQGELNDSVGGTIGGYFDITPTPYLRLTARAGFQYASFDTGGTFTTGIYTDSSDLIAYYWNVTVANRINAYVSQSVSAGRENDLGLTSNYLKLDFVRYNVSWRALSNVTIGADGFFEHGDESGGIFNETLNRYGGDVTFGYQFNLQLSATLHYAYIQKDSDVDFRGYYQNRVGVDVFYRF